MNQYAPDETSRDRNGHAVVIGVFMAVEILIHLVTTARYGFFRDELYYLDCADHLAWGYVDHPPLSIAILALDRALLGSSILALRLPAILGGAATIGLTGLLACEMGGGVYAVALACLSVLAAPVYLSLSDFYSMNAFDPVLWTLSALLVARIARTGNQRLWPAVGLVVGLGLMNKISMAFFAAGLVVALVFTPLRRSFLDRRLWLAGLIAALLFLPHILWQVQNGWPTLEFIRNATERKNLPHSPLEFLSAQILLMGPSDVPVWLTGLIWMLFSRRGRPFRVLGLVYVGVCALLVAQNAKAYYLASAYPMLLAGGAVAIEGLRSGRAMLRPALLILLAAGGAALAPFAIPVLPVEDFIRYQRWVGLEAPREERNETGPLPQHFADRFGWEEMVETLATVYGSLPPEERAKAAIFASNYGEAGAVNFFGKRLGLPPAISGHNNHWLWGPQGATGEVMILISDDPERAQSLFESVTEAATIHHPYAMPHENNKKVYVCRGLKIPMEQLWPQVKEFI